MKLFDSILITGCCGDIAQSICKIIKMTSSATKVIGCDIHSHALAHLVFDSCHIVPPSSDDKNYSNALELLIKKHDVKLIVPTSETEIAYFLKMDALKSFKSTPVILSNKQAIITGLDKLATADFLQKNQLNAPWTSRVEDGLPRETPCILKMRRGQGGKDLIKVWDMQLAAYYQKKRPEDIWQEYLLPNHEEYTCGLYQSHHNEIRSIAIKRKLLGGLTKEGIVATDPEISNYLQEIAKKLNLRGSINVQLRLTKRGPIAFEINPRFSSTVLFRHLLGFEDFIWSLYEAAGLPITPYTASKNGTQFYRLTQEHIIR